MMEFEIFIWWGSWASIDTASRQKYKVSYVLVSMCDAICNLVPFAPYKKCKKHPGSVLLSDVFHFL